MTLSERMPKAERRLWHFDEYTAPAGGKALSIQIDIRDMGRFYAPDLRLKDAASFQYSWSGRDTSTYIPHRINNADDALNAMDRFVYPEHLRTESRRAARMLANAFQDVAKMVAHRDLTSGRLDRRKLPHIAEALAANSYDGDVIRPYYRRQSSPAKRPTIAIVGSAGNVEMWGDKDYIPRVTQLTLAVLWACEAVGLDAYAALCEAHISPFGYKTVQIGEMLAKPGKHISPNAYAVALHSDLWRYGYMTAQAADYEGNGRIARSDRGQPNTPDSIGDIWSRNGGRAVHWARTMLKADLVISVGENTDRLDADITLGSTFTTLEACEEIARQAKKLKGR